MNHDELAKMSPEEHRAHSRMILAEQLEHAVDTFGLPNVLDMLAEVAHVKADRVLEVWQDAPLARRWRSVAGLLERVSRRPSVAV